jgi:2-C-methyl-D-erythritol 4-phosphate cytidylyltransferase/2-C-methyl-D-erythritol 4-phosphate cytidylyltransferase/2-C-methyl-D-erythritol 2,4-cyclodiphosphate synthase
VSSPVERRIWAVVPAAGRGLRFASDPSEAPKQYATLRGATVIEWSLAALRREPRIERIVIALAPDDTRWPQLAASLAGPRITTAIGGASRQESVLQALEALEGHAAPADWILVHDAARPCLTSADLAALIDALERPADPTIAGAVLAAPIVDTVKRERSGIAVDTVDRTGLWRALTPQAFGYARLKQALEDAARAGLSVTDEAQAMERLGLPAGLVRGSPFNIKVTTPADLAMAEAILKGTEHTRMRIGQGFDVHAFGDGDHVVLGGVRIEYPRGIVAHSDGDVVIHALCDALFGALGMGDIGQHFPDTDRTLRGANSRVFLREVAARMRAAGLTLVNADVTVLAEAPRIAKHRGAMAQNLAADLGVSEQIINIKATTTEKLGFIGRGEGLAASAAVLLDAYAPR